MILAGFFLCGICHFKSANSRSKAISIIYSMLKKVLSMPIVESTGETV